MQRDLIIRQVPAWAHARAVVLAAEFARDYPDREAGVRHGVAWSGGGYPPMYVYRTRTAIVVRGQSHADPA